jgi:formylmethanofuran dehydrogenase subunit D
MTSPRNGISLAIVTHEDVHLVIARLREGWGDAYQKKAAVIRLSRTDLEKLGTKDNARMELTGPAGSVVVTSKLDAMCEAGIGFMPASLYTNRLADYGAGSPAMPRKHIEVRAVATEKAITPVSDLKVRRNGA